ncbi:MAG: hypothetical protein BroJett030_24840 [Alphaproteobacteria bacterium]|nr:MAG: hypothetical protein BroJett030_24840 [Alphaproteobacteria bacterium]
MPIEADLLILSFLGHFAWELLQAPLFASLDGADHVTGILICLRATLGDMVIALSAYWAAAIAGGGRRWVTRPGVRDIAVFVATGLIATVVLEHLSTEVLDRWSYGSAMPRLPVLGTGLAPILQWLIVPTIVLWYLMRLARAEHRC